MNIPRSSIADYPPPPARVPIAQLGEYLYQRRLQVVRAYHNSRNEFIVEVVERPISTEMTEDPNHAAD